MKLSSAKALDYMERGIIVEEGTKATLHSYVMNYFFKSVTVPVGTFVAMETAAEKLIPHLR